MFEENFDCTEEEQFEIVNFRGRTLGEVKEIIDELINQHGTSKIVGSLSFDETYGLISLFTPIPAHSFKREKIVLHE